MTAGEVRSFALCLLAVFAVGCGSSPQGSSSTTPSSTPQEAPASDTAFRVDPNTELGRNPQVTRYRPPGAEPFLAALTRSPASPDALLDAARFYATGDVAGMSLLWLMMRASMSPSLPMEETGRLYADILRRRLEQTVNGDSRSLSIRLAPGGILVLPTDHGMVGALAHLIEMEFGMAMTPVALGGDGQWTQSGLVDSLRALVQSYRADDSALHPHVEWIAWVSALEQAGHLDAFVARLIGSSMPTGMTQADNVTIATQAAEAAYVAAHPFRPTRAILPDDFLLLRREL